MILEELIEEGYRLKSEISRKQERLKDIHKQIVESIDFEGKKSKSISSNNVKARIQLKDNIKWDQSKLAQLKDCMPDMFFSNFKIEFSPISNAKIEKIEDKNFRDGIAWAREITPGAPQISYELISDEQMK